MARIPDGITLVLGKEALDDVVGGERLLAVIPQGFVHFPLAVHGASLY